MGDMLKIIVVIIAVITLVGFLSLIIIMNFSEDIIKRKKYKEWANYTPLAEDARMQRHGINGATYQKMIEQINILLNEAISKGATHIEISRWELDLDSNNQIPFDIIKDYYESFDYEVYREHLMNHVIIRWEKEDE